jgi:NAD(P)-dependent dehydrogenase (short-subunit alcohol dehydrogenase family)
MHIAGSTALVTGANRGLGREIARQLVERGATVYAGARDVASVDLPGVVPVRIDLMDEASVRAAAEETRDVTLLVNNAGVSTGTSLLDGDLADVHREMDVHYFGTLAVVRAFAPQLTARGGAVLNVLSTLSWVSFPATGAYCAAKSAEWSMTNALRQELAPRGVAVTALHVGYMETDMARHVDGPKSSPADVARLALDGVAAGVPEVLADEGSKRVQAGLAGGVPALYPQLAGARA